MALEDLTGNNKYISNLVQTNPVGATDYVSQGDDHIRGIKNVILNTFPNITGPVELTQQELNALASIPVQMPVGMVADFAGTVIPDGWMPLPFVPTNISRSTYAALYAAIGTTWGAGDGSSTFGMPYVMDGGAALNHSTAGGETSGAVKNHTHTVSVVTGAAGGTQDVNAGGDTAAGNITSSNPSGGNANNLPAGSYFRKCIRYI
jgi:microcystin-dependent protein